MAKARTEAKRAVCVACGAVALALGGLLIPAAAQAEETVCRGALGAVTVDNLLVPQGANCALTGTRVQGTIKVQRNAALNAAAVRVIGNVQGENARNVVVRGGSRVGGSVQVVQGQAATVRDSVVTQDILYDHNRAALRAISNTVGGNIQAFQNTGGVQISFNRVNGNLQCKENVPPPTGGGNVVQGNKEDQCARL